MKTPTLYHEIAASTAHRKVREDIANRVLKHPGDFSELISIALDLKDKNHYKACWILELVLEARLDLLDANLNDFCAILPLYKQDGAVRSASKICMFLIQKHVAQFKKGNTFLTAAQFGRITETCFDRMILDTKVASKVYAMRSLFNAGKIEKRLHAALLEIIGKDFPQHSPAYKSAAKDVLRQINSPKK